MAEIFETAIVEKRNVLNELRSNNMTLQELRFFSIYLSKINPFDILTRAVRFPLSDFQRIMGFGRLNIRQLKSCTDSLLCKIVHIPDERGGYTAFQLFKRCRVSQDDSGEWYVEIDAHDEALPLMFEFKNRYFKYELWNALRLKSPNQVRMYEILKQYEWIGKRELTVNELRELLGIGANEYSGRTGWSDFKKYVLDSCQQALKENTDICFTYERGKTGKGGKWLSVIFHIKKNAGYKDPLSLNEFLEQQPKTEQPALDSIGDNGEFVGQTSLLGDYAPAPLPFAVPVEDPGELIPIYGSEQLAILAEGCGYEFDKAQMEQIFAVLQRINIPKDHYTDDLTWGRQNYLHEKYAALNAEASGKERKGQKPITDRFKYFLGMLERDTFQPASY